MCSQPPPHLSRSGFSLPQRQRGGGIKSDSCPLRPAFELKHNGAEKLGGPFVLGTILHIGLDPRNLERPLCQLLERGAQPCPSNYRYCVENPKQYKGYGEDCWGLTASYSPKAMQPTARRQRPWCHHTDSSLVQFSLHTGGIHACTEVFLFQRRLDLGQVRILRCLLRGEVTGRCPAILPSTNAPLPR